MHASRISALMTMADAYRGKAVEGRLARLEKRQQRAILALWDCYNLIDDGGARDLVLFALLKVTEGALPATIAPARK